MPKINPLQNFNKDETDLRHLQVVYLNDQNFSFEEIEQTELVRVLFRNNKMESRLRPKNVGTGVTYIAEIIIDIIEVTL